MTFMTLRDHVQNAHLLWSSVGHWSIFQAVASSKTMGERKKMFGGNMSGYARFTLRCHRYSAVVDDKACRSANLYIPGRPTDRRFHWAHITRKRKCFDRFRWFKNIWNAFWADEVQDLYKIGKTFGWGGGCDLQKFAYVGVVDVVVIVVSSFVTKGGSRVSREPFETKSPTFTPAFRPTWPTLLPDMTSLISSDRLQNAPKYCRKLMRKTCRVGQRVK